MLVESCFQPARWLANPHVQTLWQALCRRRPNLTPHRRRLELPDGDFIDIDCFGGQGRRTVIVGHGLEGSSRSRYLQGATARLLHDGWNVWAWNMRGCSGEPNRLPRSYHAGASEDLAAVFGAAQAASADPLAVVGFSLGANLALKFAGENSGNPALAAVVAVSCPCDLEASAERLDSRVAAFYRYGLLRPLRRRTRAKARRHGLVPAAVASRARTFRQFDDAYTAPVHGFKDAADYWRQCSAVHFVSQITAPALLLNAGDDPLLTPSCSPSALLRSHPTVCVETPRQGGHIGFISRQAGRLEYWGENRVAGFLNSACPA